MIREHSPLRTGEPPDLRPLSLKRKFFTPLSSVVTILVSDPLRFPCFQSPFPHLFDIPIWVNCRQVRLSRPSSLVLPFSLGISKSPIATSCVDLSSVDSWVHHQSQTVCLICRQHLWIIILRVSLGRLSYRCQCILSLPSFNVGSRVSRDTRHPSWLVYKIFFHSTSWLFSLAGIRLSSSRSVNTRPSLYPYHLPSVLVRSSWFSHI